MASGVSSSEASNTTLPHSIPLPATTAAKDTGASPGITTQTGTRHKSSLRSTPSRKSTVKFDPQTTASVAVAESETIQVHVPCSETASQSPPTRTFIHALEDSSTPFDIHPQSQDDSDLKQIGLRKVYVQRLLNLEVLRAKYSEVLSSETVPFAVYEDKESRWSYDEVFQHFTVYPFSAYCVLRFCDGEGHTGDSGANLKYHTSCADELYKDLRNHWNEYGLLQAITAFDFMKKKLEPGLERMLADEKWADLTRTAISLDMNDMAFMLESVSNGQTREVANIAKSILIPTRELSASGGGATDGTSLALANILQLFIDRKDSRSPTLLRLLQRIMDVIGLAAIPDSMYISGDAKPVADDEFEVKSGGYGDVIRMEMGHAGFVAMKKLKEDTEVKRLVRESCVWRQLDHINVLPFYGLYNIPEEYLGKPSLWDKRAKKEPLPAMVSPWMKNGDLTSFMENNPDLSNLDRRKICIGIAKGLLYLHTHEPQIIHGDLKGLNILFDENGLPKLADFGLFRTIDKKATRQMTQKIGINVAPEYMGGLTTKSDVFAFGCVMHEVYTGYRPEHTRLGDAKNGCTFQCPNRLSEDREIWSIISKCSDINPMKRPDIGAVLHLLYPWKPLPFLSYVLESDQVREGMDDKESEGQIFPNYDHGH